MHPAHGQHLLLCNRSAVLLQLGRKQEALEDAFHCLDLSPPGFVKVCGCEGCGDKTGPVHQSCDDEGSHSHFFTLQAWLRLIDSYYALERYGEASATTRKAVDECPGFTSIPEFKVWGVKGWGSSRNDSHRYPITR